MQGYTRNYVVKFMVKNDLKQPFVIVAILNKTIDGLVTKLKKKEKGFKNICIIMHIWHIKQIMLFYRWCLYYALIGWLGS